MSLELKVLFLFVGIMPPWRGRDRPRRVPTDEEAALALYAPHP